MRRAIRRVAAAPKVGATVALDLGRAVRDVTMALPHVGRNLPDLMQELNRVVANVARLTSQRGELTILMRELARFLRVHAATRADADRVVA